LLSKERKAAATGRWQHVWIFDSYVSAAKLRCAERSGARCVAKLHTELRFRGALCAERTTSSVERRAKRGVQRSCMPSWVFCVSLFVYSLGGGGGGWARRSRAGCDNLSHWHNM